MLLGPRDFIDEAAIWQRRQGGTMYTAVANIVSARMRLADCLERMPSWLNVPDRSQTYLASIHARA